MLWVMVHIDAIVVHGAASLTVAAEVERAREYAVASRADNTRQAYAGAWKRFVAWCAARDLTPMPATPSIVGVYLGHLADTGMGRGPCKPATIRLALTAIVAAHRQAHAALDTRAPEIADTMRGIGNRLGTAKAKKAPLLIEDLRRVVAHMGDSVADIRDRALLCTGFFGAFRRSELVDLDVTDIAIDVRGVLVTLRRSKTDQAGEGRAVPIVPNRDASICAMKALQAWLAHVPASGPLFRAVSQTGKVGGKLSGKDIARIVQRRTKAAGVTGDFAGHSLRAGFATTAARQGKRIEQIMQTTGHKSVNVALGYVREARMFEDSATDLR